MPGPPSCANNFPTTAPLSPKGGEGEERIAEGGKNFVGRWGFVWILERRSPNTLVGLPSVTLPVTPLMSLCTHLFALIAVTITDPRGVPEHLIGDAN